jgi:hypothetical protein
MLSFLCWSRRPCAHHEKQWKIMVFCNNFALTIRHNASSSGILKKTINAKSFLRAFKGDYQGDLALYLLFSEKKSITLDLARNLALCFSWAGMTYSSPFSQVLVLPLIVSSIFPSITIPH